MKTDRRGFLRILGGAIALVSRGPAPASAQERAPEIHRATRNTRLGAIGQRRPRFGSRPAPFKAYPGSERLALPIAGREASPSLAASVRGFETARGFASAPLPLDRLGRLLYLTNGVTGRRRLRAGVLALRAAPSAGALYSGEVYVAAERVEGLAPGLYYYDVAGHGLVEIRRGALAADIERALERPAAIRGAPAVILLTNVFERYTWRYANRGYRYALIDSGHIGENLRLAARSMGLAEAGPLRFHDDLLNRRLGLDGREEAVCALHAAGAASEPGPSASAGLHPLVEKQQAAGGAMPARGSLPARYHEATKLVPAGTLPDEGVRPGTFPPTPAPPAPAAELPGPAVPPPASVGEAVRQRRSAMGFAPDPVALEELGFVLEMARGHGALERAPGVDLYVAAHRVRDLDPGLYRYATGRHRLERIRPGDLSRPMVAACLGQAMAGSAAAGFLMVARLRGHGSGLGDRSYRDQLLEAGAVGQRVYLASEALGLAARNLAAFLDDDLNRLMGWDGAREAVVHLTMLGHE